MNKYVFIVALVICCVTNAQVDNYDIPFLWGGLDWSSDGQYLAVATTHGVHIHRSDDLSVVEVLNETDVISTVEWSHNGYKLAYDDQNNSLIMIHDFETGENNVIRVTDEERFRTTSIQWSPDDTMLSHAPNFWRLKIRKAWLIKVLRGSEFAISVQFFYCDFRSVA